MNRQFFTPSTRRGIVFVATLVVGGAVMWFVLSRLGTEAEVATAITDAEQQELWYSSCDG